MSPPCSRSVLPIAWSAGFDGSNEQVAVIDSGIDVNHPALAGKVVYEACFSNGSCPNGGSVQTGAGSAQPCDLGLACQHGTHVAGIVAGTDQSFPGVAPGAGLVSLQVFSTSTNPNECGAAGTPCPRARTSDVLAALNHLVDVRASFPQLVAVNMSLSSDAALPSCNTSVLAGAVTKLKSLGVATVVASGNSGATNGLGVPACISDTVSVGATYADQDAVWPLSNVSADLDLLAPGVAIESPAPGGGYSPTTGTSAASPHVAGAWAIVAQRLGTSDVEHDPGLPRQRREADQLRAAGRLDAGEAPPQPPDRRRGHGPRCDHGDVHVGRHRPVDHARLHTGLG